MIAAGRELSAAPQAMQHLRRVIFWLILTTVLVVGSAAAWLAGTDQGQTLWAQAAQHSPQSLIRYLKRRLEGHPKLEAVLLPPLHAAQRHIEREPPPGPLPTLGKGQQAQALPPVRGLATTLRVDTPQAIRDALAVRGLPVGVVFMGRASSEAELLGVELMPGELISAPRIAGSPVQMECIFHSSIQYGSDGAEAIVGEVVRFHVDDELIEDGKISDATWDGLGAHYDTRQKMDLVFSIGHYVMTSWALSSFGVGIEGGADPIGFDLKTGSGRTPGKTFKPGESDNWTDTRGY